MISLVLAIAIVLGGHGLGHGDKHHSSIWTYERVGNAGTFHPRPLSRPPSGGTSDPSGNAGTFHVRPLSR